MKPTAKHFLLTLLMLGCIAFLFTGCATKGGWPCWKWQANTDQKNERWAEFQQHFSEMETNRQPVYFNGDDKPAGYVDIYGNVYPTYPQNRSK